MTTKNEIAAIHCLFDEDTCTKYKTKELKQLFNWTSKSCIHVAIRQNAQGIVYGLTYVDHINKSVFNGKDIGKEYSAKAVMEKFEGFQQKQSNQQVQKMELNIVK